MKHYILVQWRRDGQDPPPLKELEALFRPATAIPGVFSVELRPAVLHSEKRYDLMILFTLEQEALAAFDQSSIHRVWKERYGSRLAQKAIFDCD